MVRKGVLKCVILATALLSLTTAKAQPRRSRPISIDGAASISAFAMDLATGQTAWAYNEDLWLTPASLTKVLTTGAALQTKGADAKLLTRIELLSNANSDTHSLRIAGEFDPTMNSSYFKENTIEAEAPKLAAKLKERGITNIDSICVDDSRQSADVINPKILWEDMGNYYGAPPTIVCFKDNSASLFFTTPAALGQPCSLDSIVPNIPELTVTADVTTHNSNADKCQVRWHGHDVWHATGYLPKGRKAFKVKSVLPHPTLRYAEALANALRNEGVNVASVTTGSYANGDLIMTISSPSLGDIVRVTNHESVNLFADALAMNLALTNKASGRIEWPDAADAVMGFWKERYGLSMKLDDGSGLSTQGAFSARTMVKVLSAMRNSRVWASFKESLPIVGRTGTVSSLGGKLAVSGHAHAKSGTMSGVVGYAGVIDTLNGREIAFCIIVNHHKEGVWTVRGAIAEWLNKLYNDKK